MRDAEDEDQRGEHDEFELRGAAAQCAGSRRRQASDAPEDQALATLGVHGRATPEAGWKSSRRNGPGGKAAMMARSSSQVPWSLMKRAILAGAT